MSLKGTTWSLESTRFGKTVTTESVVIWGPTLVKGDGPKPEGRFLNDLAVRIDPTRCCDLSASLADQDKEPDLDLESR